MRAFRNLRFPAIVAVLLLLSVCPLPAEETPAAAAEPTPRQIGEQVDVLKIVADLELDKDQITQLALKATALVKKNDEELKAEEAILAEIKSSLKAIRDKLAAGQEAPDSAASIAEPKLRELANLRKQFQQDFASTVESAVQLVTSRQERKLIRNPSARIRAAQIVKDVRSTPEEAWQKTLTELTSELLEVRKANKEPEWQVAQNKFRDLTGEEKNKAKADFEKQKGEDIEQMRADIAQRLMNIRSADSRVLPTAIDNLCSDITTKAQVRMQLMDAMARILSSPCARDALNARLEHLKGK